MTGARWHLVVAVCLTMLLSLAQLGVTENSPANELEYSAKATYAAHSLLLDGVAAGDRVVVVGERGHILYSDDRGGSWTQATVPTRATLTGVFFHDQKLGWAVGHDAIILRTRDGGESWERVYQAIEEESPLLDVWFSDAQNGVAIGAYGYFLRTSDSGDTWAVSPIRSDADAPEGESMDSEPSDFHLNHFAESSNGHLYIAAEAGTVYRSDNDGKSWQSLPSPYHGSFFSTLPLDNNSVLLLGLRGHLYRSENNGDLWEELQIPADTTLTDGVRLKNGTLVIVGLAGTVLVSNDGGRRFEIQQQADRQGLTAVFETNAGDVMMVGEFGVSKLHLAKLAGKPEF